MFAAVLAFAAGIAVGLICGRAGSDRVTVVDGLSDGSARPESASYRADAAHTGGFEADSTENIPSETTVEVTYADASDAAPPEIAAAHRARQARRLAAREARSGQRRDFLAALNLDLLAADQQRLHAEYAEAVAVRDEVRRQIRDFRMKGENVPADLSKRLADAESVIRADAAEEHRALRAAAARVHGLDDAGVEALLEDLASIDSAMGVGGP